MNSEVKKQTQHTVIPVMPLGHCNTQTQNQQQGLLLMRFNNFQNISVSIKNVKKLEST
jgi:hypothetical protein